MEKSVKLKPEMTINELTTCIQKAVGTEVRIRVDEGGLALDAEVTPQNLFFPPGTAKLSEVFYKDLEDNGLDFSIDAQGIVIIPSSRAWNYAEYASYKFGDLGVNPLALKELMMGVTRIDDWDENGGPAQIKVNYETMSIDVFHMKYINTHRFVVHLDLSRATIFIPVIDPCDTHHQFFQGEGIHPEIAELIRGVFGIVPSSTTWDDYDSLGINGKV